MGSFFQGIINSRLGVGAALGFGRTLPPALGYPLAKLVARGIASSKQSAIVQTVRVNQWVVNNGQLSGAALDQAVSETFVNTARCIYELYHNQEKPLAMKRLVVYSQEVEALIERSRRIEHINQIQGKEKGAVIVGVHLSNFDLVLQAVCLSGLNVQAISVAQPGGGYRWQNKMRQKSGVYITPASTGSLRQAIERLKMGGSVLTAADWPVPESRYKPSFFGRPTCVPVHHVYLALKTGTPVYVFAATRKEDGLYHVKASEPITMKNGVRHNETLLYNADAILEVAEDYISQAPQQWSMFYPVWPEAMSEME
jgi:lauroyl/myristoyl acyltransferase